MVTPLGQALTLEAGQGWVLTETQPLPLALITGLHLGTALCQGP